MKCMTLSELRDIIDRAIENHDHYGGKLVPSIVVKTVGQIGGTPSVGITSIQSGFDWDAGKLLIYPEKDLRTIEADELLALRKANEKQGWAEYENRGLKAEVKRLRKQLDETNRNIP